jgi:hypothetical protein
LQNTLFLQEKGKITKAVRETSPCFEGLRCWGLSALLTFWTGSKFLQRAGVYKVPWQSRRRDRPVGGGFLNWSHKQRSVTGPATVDQGYQLSL